MAGSVSGPVNSIHTPSYQYKAPSSCFARCVLWIRTNQDVSCGYVGDTTFANDGMGRVLASGSTSSQDTW
eukprot:5345718-Prymnesium_polylepis.1